MAQRFEQTPTNEAEYLDAPEQNFHKGDMITSGNNFVGQYFRGVLDGIVWVQSTGGKDTFEPQDEFFKDVLAKEVETKTDTEEEVYLTYKSEVTGKEEPFQLRKFLANGDAEIYREYGYDESGKEKVEKRLISKEELAIGVEARNEMDRLEELEVAAQKAQQELLSNIGNDVEGGISLDDAVRAEARRAKEEALAAGKRVDSLPSSSGQGNGLILPPISLEEFTQAMNEHPEAGGQVSRVDVAESAARLPGIVEAEVKAEAQAEVLKEVGARIADVLALKHEEKKLRSSIRQILREVEHAALLDIREEDVLALNKLKDVPPSKIAKELAKLPAEEALAYKAAQSARQHFVNELAKIGVPGNVARSMFGMVGSLIEDNKFREKAERERVAKEENDKATALILETQGKDSSSEIPSVEPVSSTQSEAEQFILRGNKKLARPESGPKEYAEKMQSTYDLYCSLNLEAKNLGATGEAAETLRRYQAAVRAKYGATDKNYINGESIVKLEEFESQTEKYAAQIYALRVELAGAVKPAPVNNDPVPVPSSKRSSALAPTPVPHVETQPATPSVEPVVATSVEALAPKTETPSVQNEARAREFSEKRMEIDALLQTVGDRIDQLAPETSTRKLYDEFFDIQQRYIATPPFFRKEGDLKLMEAILASAKILEGKLYLPVLAEAIPVKAEATKPGEVSYEVLKAFEKSGISQGELMEVEGFAALSEGQQLLMLRNYTSELVYEVKSKGGEQAAAEWNARSWKNKLGWSILTLGVKRVYEDKVKQKEILETILAGDSESVASRKAKLSVLARVAAKEGPVVTKQEDGSLRIHYLSAEEERFKSNPEAAAVLEAYNKAATNYSSIPTQWLEAESVLSRNEKQGHFARLLEEKNKLLGGREYVSLVTTREEYKKAKINLAKLLESSVDSSVVDVNERQRRVALELSSLSEQVQLNQLFSSEPNAEKALSAMQDTTVFNRAMREYMVNRGQYAAYGILTRIAAAAISGGIALPAGFAIAGGAGYAQSKREARDILRQRRISGALSDIDLEEEVTYTSNCQERLEERTLALKNAFARNAPLEEIAQVQTDIDDVTAKLKAGIKVEQRTRRFKEFRNATFYIGLIERLDARLQVANDHDDTEGAERVARQMAKAATMVRMMMQNGQLDFVSGAGKDLSASASLVVREELILALGKADAAQNIDNFALSEKIENLLSGRTEEIHDSDRMREKAYVRRAVTTKLKYFFAGYGLSHVGGSFFGDGGWGNAHAGITEKGSDWGEAHSSDWGESTSSAVLGGASKTTEASLESHAVVVGETLTGIARKLPGISKLAGADQNIAIGQFMNKLTSEQVHELGISSGNVDKIMPGEHIDLNKLQQYFSEARGGGQAVAENAVPSVESVAEKAQEALIPNPAKIVEVSDAVDGIPAPARIVEIGEAATPKVEGLRTVAPEILAAVNKKFNGLVYEMFGQKNFFGSDKMGLWDGDPLKGVVGLKNSSAEEILSARPTFFSGVSKEVDLRSQLESLRESTHINPLKAESVSDYIRRALAAKEEALAQAAQFSKRVVAATAEATTLPRPATLVEIDSPSSVSAVVKSVAEAVSGEKLVTTNDALETLMPVLLKKYDAVATLALEEKATKIAQFLREAQPVNMKALGFAGDEVHKLVSGGKVSIEMLIEYFKTHGPDGVRLASVVQDELPPAAKIVEIE